jgi:hypothetical protein
MARVATLLVRGKTCKDPVENLSEVGYDRFNNNEK